MTCVSAAAAGAVGGHCVGAGQWPRCAPGETPGCETRHPGVEVQVRGHSEAGGRGEGEVRLKDMHMIFDDFDFSSPKHTLKSFPSTGSAYFPFILLFNTFYNLFKKAT